MAARVAAMSEPSETARIPLEEHDGDSKHAASTGGLAETRGDEK
jgi:hypothetical protein